MKYNFVRFPGGKVKAITLSYDDGAVEDFRFAETINRYGLKCTYNLIGSRVEQETGLTKEFIRKEILEKGHEIANHGFHHRALDTMRPVEAIRDTLDSRLYLEREFGIIVRGMAFPDRTVNRFKTPQIYEQVKSILKELDIVYTRAAGGDNDSFALPEDWNNWTPTAHHGNPQLMEYIDKFLNMDVSSLYIASRAPKVFFLWGHAFEFERTHGWDLLDTICQKLSGHEEIWYATNMEIYEYVQAYRSLIWSADGLMVRNPTLVDVWFDVDGVLYCIHPGETIRIEDR